VVKKKEKTIKRFPIVVVPKFTCEFCGATHKNRSGIAQHVRGVCGKSYLEKYNNKRNFPFRARYCVDCHINIDSNSENATNLRCRSCAGKASEYNYLHPEVRWGKKTWERFKKERAKWKGKTIEELFGKDKAREIRKKESKKRGKYEEYMGIEKAKEVKKKVSVGNKKYMSVKKNRDKISGLNNYKGGKTHVEVFGKKKAKEISKKIGDKFRDKTYEEILGLEKAKKRRKQHSREFKKMWKSDEYRKLFSELRKKMWKSDGHRDKIMKTKIENGTMIPYELRPDMEKYYIQVDIHTKESLKKYYYIVNPHNRTIGRGLYQLDHIYSKVDGFKNNVDPRFIGNAINLQVISENENCSKNRRSDIFLSDLKKYFIREPVIMRNPAIIRN